jgi:hypothetical protein
MQRLFAAEPGMPKINPKVSPRHKEELQLKFLRAEAIQIEIQALTRLAKTELQPLYVDFLIADLAKIVNDYVDLDFISQTTGAIDKLRRELNR